MPGSLYKGIGMTKIRKNFLFRLAEELDSDHHDERNTSFDSKSNYIYIKSNLSIYIQKVYIQDRV